MMTAREAILAIDKRFRESRELLLPNDPDPSSVPSPPTAVADASGKSRVLPGATGVRSQAVPRFLA